MSPVFRVFRHVVTRILERSGPPGILLKWQAWENFHFGEPEIRLLRYLVNPLRTALDIGAADGVYTFYLQRLALRCIAFEPNPSSAFELRRALPDVEIHCAAASAVEGEVSLRIPVVNGAPYKGWGTIEPKNQLAELPPHTIQEIMVRTVRPDRMPLGDVGFVKIDVEGHELDVLTGLSEMIAKCRPTLLIEIGGADRGGALSDVERVLEPFGYVGLMLDDRGLLRALSKDIDIKGSKNIIFFPTIALQVESRLDESV